MKHKKPETEAVKFRIEKTDMERVRELAKLGDRSYSKQINRMLKYYIAQKG